MLDVYNERPLTYERPADELQTQYDTYRERFYMNSVRRAATSNGNDAHVELAEYYCTTWADEHDVDLERVNMYWITEDVTMDTLDDPDERERDVSALYQHGCGDNEPAAIYPPE